MTSSLLGGPRLSALLEISQNGGGGKRFLLYVNTASLIFMSVFVWAFFFFCCAVRLQDLSRLGIKQTWAVEGQSPNYWTVGEFLKSIVINI